VPSSYHLAGAGIGLNYEQPGGYSARGTLAAPIGGNPARAANNGNDSDGRNRSVRLWV